MKVHLMKLVKLTMMKKEYLQIVLSFQVIPKLIDRDEYLLFNQTHMIC
jgi:hypothetical protein